MHISNVIYLVLAATAAARPRPVYDAQQQREFEKSPVITTLFTDSNDAESRAEFTVGKWNFAGFAAYPIHVITQEGHRAQCTYTGMTSGAFKIMGSGKVKVSPPQHIKDVDCSEL